ncbi:MgtC/SapB family protein [Lagierella sp. ICN-221743]
MDVVLTPTEIIIRLLISSLIGFVVGLDREKHSSAGVRTNMILAVGACIITLVQANMTEQIIKWNMNHPDYIGVLSADTVRLTAQIISGIGFLGSGLILVRNKVTVNGMTSAVSLWTVASICIAVGYGEYVISLLGSGLLIIILTLLNNKKISRGIMTLKINFRGNKIDRTELETFLEEYHSKIKNYTMENIVNNDENEYRYVFEIEYRGFVDKIKFIDSYVEKNKDINYIELI